MPNPNPPYVFVLDVVLDEDAGGVPGIAQENVRSSLETLRNAGVAVWMLTGTLA